jgi:hypothetical protein
MQSSATTGIGYILVNPWAANSSSTIIYKTTDAYAGSGATTFTLAAGVSAVSSPKFPYTSSEIGITGVKYRIVGCGLRVRYTGITLYEGGRAVMLRHPDNTTFVSNGTVDGLFDYSQAKTFPVTREWTQVVYKPVAPTDYEYSDLPDQPELGVGAPRCMAFAVTGTAGPNNSSASFEYEVVTHVEYIGKVDAITKSHADVIGMSHIRNATMGDRPTRHSHKHLVKTLKEIGTDVLESVSPMVMQSISGGQSHGFFSDLMRQGRNVGRFISRIPAQLERGAMSALRRTFSGGLLDTLAPAFESMALAL